MIVDAGGFGPLDESETPGGCATSVLVVGGQRAAVTRALMRTAPRLYSVRTDGADSDDDEAMAAGGQISVSYVSAPAQRVRGVELWVDLESMDLPAPMAARFRAIVREELTRAGVAEARLEVPDEVDRETAEQALFASAGVRSVHLRGIGDTAAVIEVLQRGLGGGALMLVSPRAVSGELQLFLRRFDAAARTPLAYLVADDLLQDHDTGAQEGFALPLEDALIDAFWDAAERSGEVALAMDQAVWFVRDGDVLARVCGHAARMREDAPPDTIEALRVLQDPDVVARGRNVREWHDIIAARRRARRIRARLEPVDSDWWETGWRTWEPVGPAPDSAPPPFDPLEAAKRLRGSARALPAQPHQWRWWRAPFGPTLSREEAWAWLMVSRVSQRVSGAVARFERWDAPPVDGEEAERAGASWRLPPAANLRALATIVGVDRTLTWLELMLARGPGYRHRLEDIAGGVRAGLLPLMTPARRQALADRVREDCERAPWIGTRDPPHPSYALAGPLGVSDVCARTIAANRQHLPMLSLCHSLIHGLGSRDAAVAVYDEAKLVITEPDRMEALIAITGPEGADRAIGHVAWLVERNCATQAETCLWPLLRKPWPQLEPGMRNLLDTPLDERARAWLKRLRLDRA